MAQLGKRCGVSAASVSKWLKHPKFPIQREAPWSDDDVREIQVWRDAVLRPNRADPAYRGRTTEPPAEDQSKDYWLMRRYRAMALEQEGELLAAQQVVRAWSQTMSDIRDQLLMVPPSVQGLLNLSDEQTDQLGDYIRETLTGIADRMGDLAENARTLPGGGEGDQAGEADEPERVGGES